MMNFNESMDAFASIEGWKVVTRFAIGGFEWLGFSVKSPNKMLCISTQRTTIVDCDTGNIKDCVIKWDEQKCIAICDELPDETISIVGQYAGRLQIASGKGEKVFRVETDKNVEKISFLTPKQEVVIDWNYRPYVSGFSGNGNYYVHATDAGIVILRRKPEKIDIEECRREIEREIFQRGYEKVRCQVFPPDNGIAFFTEAQKTLSETDIGLKVVVNDTVLELPADEIAAEELTADEIEVEEFARLRKNAFHNAVAACIVFAVACVLLLVMMGSNVDDANVYKFRTFTFMIGLVQIGIIGFSSKKVRKLQKEHPEWIANTAALRNKVTEPTEWKIRRLGIMIAVLVTVILRFFDWYEPGSKNIYDGTMYQNLPAITQNASDPTKSISYQNALNAISEQIKTTRQITYQCMVGDPLRTELLILSSNGVGQKYIITLSENQSFDYFRDEFPSESEYELEEFSISDEEWEALVSVINDNEFDSLPEILPEGEVVYDGSAYAIQVETGDAVYLVQGGKSGDSDEKEHQRFNAVRDAIKELSY